MPGQREMARPRHQNTNMKQRSRRTKPNICKRNTAPTAQGNKIKAHEPRKGTWQEQGSADHAPQHPATLACMQTANSEPLGVAAIAGRGRSPVTCALSLHPSIVPASTPGWLPTREKRVQGRPPQSNALVRAPKRRASSPQAACRHGLSNARPLPPAGLHGSFTRPLGTTMYTTLAHGQPLAAPLAQQPGSDAGAVAHRDTTTMHMVCVQTAWIVSKAQWYMAERAPCAAAHRPLSLNSAKLQQSAGPRIVGLVA